MSFFFEKFHVFIFVYDGSLLLHGFFFLYCGEQGLLSCVVHGLHIAMVSHFVEHGL